MSLMYELKKIVKEKVKFATADYRYDYGTNDGKDVTPPRMALVLDDWGEYWVCIKDGSETALGSIIASKGDDKNCLNSMQAAFVHPTINTEAGEFFGKLSDKEFFQLVKDIDNNIEYKKE